MVSGLNRNQKLRVAKRDSNSLINPQPSISWKPDRDNLQNHLTPKKELFGYAKIDST